MTQSFAGTDAFTVAGAPIAEESAVVEVGLDMLVNPTTTLGVTYTGQYGGGIADNGISARLSTRF